DWKGQLTNDGVVGVNADFNLANDEYGVSENRFGLGLGIQSPVGDVLSIGLNARANLSQYTNAIADYKRNLFEIDPSATYSNDQLSLKIGAKVALLDEDSSLNEDFIIYPDVRLDYNLSQNVRAYVAVSGGIQQHYYASRSTENFHISDSANLQHASETYRGTLGLSANGQKLSTNLSASYGQVDNLGVFVNRVSNPSEFDLIYDQGSTGVFTFNGLFSYNVSNSLIAELDASFYSYSTDSLTAAYHLPTIDASFNLISKINDQWSLAVGGQFIGGITALDTETGNVIDLDAFFDLSVELGYQISEQWGAFLRADNVLNTDYSRYWRYPNRQIMAKIGATYSF
ncbi:MAG: TonB-dependent receptor, partial [Bacteroidota bacterium]